MPRSSLKFLKYANDVETYHAGDVIFQEGDPGKVMYVVKAGVVDLRILDQTVETVEANSVLGEMALLDNDVRSATAVAASDCQLVPITAEKFLFLVRQTPYFALEVMQIMAQRLRRMNELARKTRMITKPAG